MMLSRLSLRGLHNLVPRGTVGARVSVGTTRWMSDAVADGPPLTAAEHEMALARDAKLREKYDTIADDYPAHAMPLDGSSLSRIDVHKKRLIYRSKQRGWLEVDLLMGSFAVKHVPDMTLDELTEYEQVLALETVTLFHYVTGQQEVPAEYDGKIMAQLKAYVASSPLGHASPETYAKDIKPLMSN